MRISDWSSDVCSSDLSQPCRHLPWRGARDLLGRDDRRGLARLRVRRRAHADDHPQRRLFRAGSAWRACRSAGRADEPDAHHAVRPVAFNRRGAPHRTRIGHLPKTRIFRRNKMSDTTPFEDVIYDIRGRAAWIIINSPKLYNAFRAQTIEERSEEHTSELQSLMRNSYSVFCLKKK